MYMLIQYQDPTNSMRRGPYQKQADGSWKALKDPQNKGGDDNVYYEDKWAFLWPVGTVRNFDKQGCTVACHLGEGKPYGNKYTRDEGEVLDMWHFKGMRNAQLGWVDDQFTDHTRYDPQKSPNAGRKSDPGGPDYAAFPLENGKPTEVQEPTPDIDILAETGAVDLSIEIHQVLPELLKKAVSIVPLTKPARYNLKLKLNRT